MRSHGGEACPASHGSCHLVASPAPRLPRRHPHQRHLRHLRRLYRADPRHPPHRHRHGSPSIRWPRLPDLAGRPMGGQLETLARSGDGPTHRALTKKMGATARQTRNRPRPQQKSSSASPRSTSPTTGTKTRSSARSPPNWRSKHPPRTGRNSTARSRRSPSVPAPRRHRRRCHGMTPRRRRSRPPPLERARVRPWRPQRDRQSDVQRIPAPRDPWSHRRGKPTWPPACCCRRCSAAR